MPEACASPAWPHCLAGVLQAAETLCDPSKRRQYDAERVVPPRRPTTSTAGGHAE